MSKGIILDLKPKKAKAKTKSAATTTAKATTSNLSKKENGKLVDLNFKVPPELKRSFKMYAAEHDMSQKEVLIKAFESLIS